MTPGILAIISLIVGFFPVLVSILAGIIANSCDCRLDEGGVHPCVIFGKDRGPMLYSMFNFAWFIFFTLPLGVLGLVVAGVWAWW